MAESVQSCQEIAISELRRRLSDLSDETYKEKSVLLKFLIARDFNEQKAEYMIRKNIRWKKEMQIDTLLSDFKPPEVLANYMTATFIGFDKEGDVVRYIPAGNFDGRGLCKSTNGSYLIKYLVKLILEDIEMHKSQIKKLKKSEAKSVHIYNAENLTLAKITHVQSVQYLLKFVMTLQDNFPEFIKKIYVINASVYFTTIWNVVKKCLGSSLLGKICICGHDGWKEELLKTIDADILPAFLGGNRTDPDGNPLCLTVVNHHFELVPKNYFLEKNIEKITRKPGVKSTTIDRQSSITELIEIIASNSIINWEFELKSYDISFGISLEVTDGTLQELIPVHRIETEFEPHIGMYRCERLGKYLVVFDNSYTWLHMKEIYYRIWVTNAGA